MFRGEESLNFVDKREETSQEYQNSGGLAEMYQNSGGLAETYQNSGGLAEMHPLREYGSRSNMSAGGSHVHVGSLTTPLDYDDSDGLE